MARDPAKRWWRAWLAAAACVALDARAADPGAPRSSADWEAATEPLLASIEDEEARNGPFSRNLVELLTSLGLAYQEHDRHDLALGMFDRALFVRRFNDGLFGLEQAAIVERLIASELAVGRVDTAAELEERLLDLARRNRGDPRAAPIFRDAAERQIDYYERYLSGDLPPTLSINGESPSQGAAASVWQARRNYNEAIFALVGNVAENQAELTELEQGLTRTYYLEASSRGRSYRGPGDRLYGMGLVSYHRRVAYTRAASPTPLDYARALVELADWSLLFSRNGTAVKRYAEAHALLVEQNVAAPTIEELFPTDIPVFLPTFAPLFDGTPVAGSTGYVDFDFEVGKYGQPRDVTIVATAGADAAAIAKPLAAAINAGRFRPSPLAGAERWTAYRLRYSPGDGSLIERP